ncbi:MAG TPA: pyridoxamine 5'-phosphate oxidase [Gemmataceae bacterium]|nr:pyridoxamine 5'-phosphate oxidase [Gemmataceae bacterium]
MILLECDMDGDPFRQFRKWFDDAVTAQIVQPEAITLATATPNGQPSARMVLLRQCDERGFCFFTNYQSEKARQLTANPRAALVIFWESLHRQVRVEGHIEKTSDAESDEYFDSRPRGSRIGAWASPQSDVLANREELEKRVQEMESRFAGQEHLPRPPFWGGFRVVPAMIEFWQGQDSRLHDRICYRRQADGSWRIERLAP